MAIIDVTEYTIGDNTYRYRDGSMVSELAKKVNYSDVESELDDTSTMPIQNQAVAIAIDNLDNAKLDKADIDSNFDIESENPVQNKVITAKINDIGDYARPAVPGSEEPAGHAGIVRVGPTLQMNTINNVEGFLDIKNPTIITPETFEPGTQTVKIADFVDNNGNIGELRAPAGGGGGGSDVEITPIIPLGNKVKIADYRIDTTEGELWAPAGGNGDALKEEIYTNQGSSADDITLTDDYDKYDLLFFTLVKSSGGDLYKTINSIETSKIVAGDHFQLMGGSAGADWLIYEVINKTQFDLDNSSQTVYVESVVGVGLGSGDTVSVTQITSTGTKIATIDVSGTDTDLYAPNYTLPIASDQALGGVKVDGNGLTIDQNGVLAVDVDSTLDSVSENPVQNKVIKTALDGKVDTNGTDRLMTTAEGTKLAGIAAGAEVNVQADWNEADNTSDAYIANKPTIPAAQVNSDWNAVSGVAEILNKPTIPNALDDLSDVSTIGVTSGQVLTYNGTGWEGATPSAGTITDVQVDNISVVSGGVANISTMTGAGSSAAGTKGLVPAPSAGDEDKFLAGDGTWKTGGGSGASALDDLTDVSIDDQTLDQGQILKYNGTVWVNDDESGGTTVIANPSGTATVNLTKLQVDNTIYSVSGGGGASAVSDLTDVELTNLVDKQVLRYNATTQKWENVTAVLTIVDITQAEYNLLTPAEKSDPTIIYHIIDGEGEQGNINRYGYTDPTMVANDGDIYYLLEANDKKRGIYLYKVNQWILIDGKTAFDGEIYNAGYEGLELYLGTSRTSGSPGGKFLDYIQIETGGGTYNNYVVTTAPVDVTNYTNLHVECYYGGQNYNEDIDITSYTGNKYISFTYLTDLSHNECAVGFSDTVTGATTFRIDSRNGSADSQKLYVLSLS